MRKIGVLSFLWLMPLMAGAAPKTESPSPIDGLKQKYVGKVFIMQRHTSNGYAVEPFVCDTASGSKGKYKNTDSHVVCGEHPLMLLSIELADGTSSVNAFGESNTAIQLRLVFTDLRTKQLVEYDHFSARELEESNTFAKTHSLIMTTPIEQHKNEVPTLLPSVIGKNLYADFDSEIFPEDTSLPHLNADHSFYEQLDKDWVTHFDGFVWRAAVMQEQSKMSGFMLPLQILKAQYSPDTDSVALKLQAPDGTIALAIAPYIDNPNIPLLERISGTLYTAIPEGLSALDLSALQQKKLTKGMSRKAAVMLYGRPDKENDYGQGGVQFVYDNGRIVYLDGDGFVEDRQYIDK